MPSRSFVAVLREFCISRLVGDAFANNTFAADFRDRGIFYEVSQRNRTQLYEAFEAPLNAGEVELLDLPILQEQLLSLVVRPNGKIDHQVGDHDDFANACAGVVSLFSLDAAPSLIKRAAVPVDAADPHPSFIVFAVFWVDCWGRAASVISARRFVASDAGPVIVVLDIQQHRSMGRSVLASIVGRLDELTHAACLRRGRRPGAVAMYGPEEWQAHALAEMHSVFEPRAAAREIVDAVFEPVPAQYLADPLRLMHSAAIHFEDGAIAFSADALAQIERLPFAGSLGWVPGSRERIEDDSLRMAALLTSALALDVSGEPMSPAWQGARLYA
jgi:hypothetical protein